MACVITDIKRKYYVSEDNEDTSSSSASEGEEMKPYNVKLSGGLHVGQQIFVKGAVKPDADRFHVNLQTSKHEDADILFHFNPRQSQNCVVRNTRLGGGWQDEEREGPEFLFTAGNTFMLRIVVRDYGYDVIVNGEFFCSYNHRGSYEEVRVLSVNGDADFHEIGIFDNLRMPYTGWMPGGMKEGKAIRILGAVKKDPYRFSINFLCESDDNAFHFNPRWDQNEVVRNAAFGEWGEEERDTPYFPFQYDEMFDMLITAVEDRYRVYVNGEHFTDFVYRCDVRDVNRIQVNGDVELVQVEFLKHQVRHHYWPIPRNLQPGDCIFVRGVVHEGGDRFHVNLQTDSHGDSPVALHVNPRQGQETVVLNDFQDGGWGEEERYDLDPAFGQNRPFQMIIFAAEEDYDVFANGRKLATFVHRSPLEDVGFVSIDGDAVFYTVQVFKLEDLGALKIPGEMFPDRWITVWAFVNNDADRFHVNLQCGSDPGADVAFHFNPRIPEGCVVRNSLEGGNWQEEEREATGMPFTQGEPFQICFGIKEDKIEVYVNGSFFIEFAHRLPMENITHLLAEGDATFLPPIYHQYL